MSKEQFAIRPGVGPRFAVMAKRFVAGETAEAALDVIAALNADGFRATLDFLGEDVRGRDEALRARDEYVELLAAMRARGVDANVSIKLTAMGLLVDEGFAAENVAAIAAEATKNSDPFVRIDMEGSAVLDATLRVFERTYERSHNVGPVLQAALKRTPADLARVIALGARVRLCKGAYREPAATAFRDMTVIRRAYLRLAEALLLRGTYPAIATHDPRIIAAVIAFAARQGVGPDRFEFQMLYGVRPRMQRELVARGFRVRIYVPYGTHWAGYFTRRIMERRENLLFALGSLVTR